MSDTAKRPQAALYARVSTKDKGQDTENQLLPLRQLAQDCGWTIIREYIEHESASGKARRTQYLQMLADAESGVYNTMAFWSLDRFSREGVEQTLRDLRRLTEAGVFWISIQDPIPREPGPMRDMVIAIMASLASLETERRRERAKAAIQLRKSKGLRVGALRRGIDRKRLEQLRNQGYTVTAMAKHLGVSRGTIHNRLDEWKLR